MARLIIGVPLDGRQIDEYLYTLKQRLSHQQDISWFVSSSLHCGLVSFCPHNLDLGDTVATLHRICKWTAKKYFPFEMAFTHFAWTRARQTVLVIRNQDGYENRNMKHLGRALKRRCLRAGLPISPNFVGKSHISVATRLQHQPSRLSVFESLPHPSSPLRINVSQLGIFYTPNNRQYNLSNVVPLATPKSAKIKK